MFNELTQADTLPQINQELFYRPVLEAAKLLLPPGSKPILLADRGFASHKKRKKLDRRIEEYMP